MSERKEHLWRLLPSAPWVKCVACGAIKSDANRRKSCPGFALWHGATNNE